jgi:hypothetical protein
MSISTLLSLSVSLRFSVPAMKATRAQTQALAKLTTTVMLVLVSALLLLLFLAAPLNRRKS